MDDMNEMNVTPLEELPPCLLAYRFPTQPQPVQVSTVSSKSNALINVVVEPSSSIYCNRIQIVVPLGTGSDGLTENQPALTVSPNTSKWTAGPALHVQGDAIGMEANTQYATFSCDCKSPADYLINYPLAFTINIQPVNNSPGTFNIFIIEYSGTTAEPKTFSKKSNTYTLEKTVSQFHLSNFVASSPSSTSAITPQSAFKKGEAIRLTWEGNATRYQLVANQQTLYDGPNTSFTLPDDDHKGHWLPTDTTTFILAASITGGPESGTPAPGYQIISLYEALTVTITDPDIIAETITATTVTATRDIAAPHGQIKAQSIDLTRGGGIEGLLNVTELMLSGPALLFGAALVISDFQDASPVNVVRKAGSDGLVFGSIEPDPAAPDGDWVTLEGYVDREAYVNHSKIASIAGGKLGNGLLLPNSFVFPVKKDSMWVCRCIRNNADIASKNKAKVTLTWVPFGKEQ